MKILIGKFQRGTASDMSTAFNGLITFDGFIFYVEIAEINQLLPNIDDK